MSISLHPKNIPFKGSLKLVDKTQQETPIYLRAILKNTNECLFYKKGDDVLYLELKNIQNAVVYTDKNPINKIEINLEKNAKNRIVKAFKKLSSKIESSEKPQAGDLLAFSQYPSRLILQAFTGSRLNHCGIACGNGLMLEALTPKSRIMNIDKRLKKIWPKFIKSSIKRRKVYLLRLNSESRKILEQNKVSFDKAVQKYNERPYGLKKLFLFVLGGLEKKTQEQVENKKTFICSELATIILKKTNILPKDTNSLQMGSKLAEIGIYPESNIYERVTRIL